MRARYFLLISALLGGAFIAPASALPLQVKSIDAPFVYFYAAPSTSKTALVKEQTPEKFTSLEKQSTFIVNFNTIPDAYKPAIQAAIDVWSENFVSSVPININATWERVATPGVLAAASPGRFHSGFTNIPDKDLWYASALANAIAGKDLDPARPEVTIRINSVNASSLYLGTDGNCPKNQYDLESMILHELGHGLGFLSNSDYFPISLVGNIQQPTPYDAYSQLPDGRRLMDLPTPSYELGTALTSLLVWSGAKGTAANNGVKPKLYTPAVWEQGSSVSHLDESTFAQSSTDAVMTPNLAPGEVFHSPGPIALGMLQDMLVKPPAGRPSGLPQVVRNPKALVGDKSAVLTFDPPINARTAQVSAYVVTYGDITKTFTTSPAEVTGLVNGVTYTFSISAKNDIGLSDPVSTNSITPEKTWNSSILDASADGKYLATGVYAGNTVVAYSDSTRGNLKLATYVKNKWSIQVVDKATKSGSVSLCVSKVSGKEVLNLFYADLTNKDLRTAAYDGKKWALSVVDGNGPKIQDYKEQVRVKSASDVSVTNACAYTPAGLQVFYRDESQGILLGASKYKNEWKYEIIDGDSTLADRSTADVAFHLRATAIDSRVYLFYDGVLSVNQEHQALRGEVRLAYRDSIYPEDWKYQVVQASTATSVVAGYDLSLFQLNKVIYGSWLAASGLSLPAPNQVQWSQLTNISAPGLKSTDLFGTPSSPIAIDDKQITFGCQSRLCVLTKSDQSIKLVSTANFDASAKAEWITVNGVKNILVASGGKLTLFRKA